MNQTSIIAAALIIAFIVFITVRGELPGYLSVFTGTAPPAVTTQSTTGKVAETVSRLLPSDPQQNPMFSFPGWGGMGGMGSMGGFGGAGSAFGGATLPGMEPL